MKRLLLLGLCVTLGSVVLAQPQKNNTSATHTLLWRISGKNIKSPSYLFGTMHMLCADDIQLSDSLTQAIKKANHVYLELDMDNIFEMMSAMSKMKMRNDTTLSDLLTKEDYEKVKTYFKNNSGLIPFSMLETYKPLLAASMIMEQSGQCDNMISMEQLIMEEAKKNGVDIKGMETMEYQMGIFDSIPYGFQAKQLVKMVQEDNKDDEMEMKEITDAYRNQELDKMEDFTKKEDMGIANFTDLLLYNRNANWAKKLDSLLKNENLVIAVGAGHLPGEKGVINLLRKAGYTVEPVKNNMIKKKTKEI